MRRRTGSRSGLAMALAGAIFGGAWASVATAQGRGGSGAAQADVEPAPATVEEFATREAARILAGAATVDGVAGDWAGAAREAEELLLRVAMSSDARRDAKAWTAAAQTLLHARFIAKATENERTDIAALFAKYPAVAQHTVFLINDQDDVPAAANVLLRLHARHAAQLGAAPALAAAMAAVHDRPVEVVANETTKQAPPIELIWAYFTTRGGRFASDVKNGPAERLVFLVDVAPDLEELEWAWGKYAGNPQVGLLYGFIEYDKEHYYDSKPKKLTKAGFSLQNIARVGGVCIDQAYFAAMVGKAIGVPTTMVVGAGESGEHHAWVGYLKGHGGRQVWDMEQGRYPDAKYFTGEVVDPRSGRWVSEAEIGIYEELLRTSAADNRLARAIVEAAELVARAGADPAPIELAAKRGGRPIPPSGEGAEALKTAALPFIRQRGEQHGEKLLRDACALSPALPEVWSAVERRAGTMAPDAMARWIESASRVAGGRWPEFTFSITERMLAKVRDDKAAARAWDRVFQLYTSRPDLAMRARVALAVRALRAGDPEAAYRAYEDGLKRFVGTGGFVVDALEGVGRLLKERKRLDVFAELAAQVWRRVERPTNATMTFDQTVWVRVGEIYATALADSGKAAEAERVRQQIKSARPTAAE